MNICSNVFCALMFIIISLLLLLPRIKVRTSLRVVPLSAFVLVAKHVERGASRLHPAKAGAEGGALAYTIDDWLVLRKALAV